MHVKNTVVFTNLTMDHLDYHGSMEEYGRVKERLFMEGAGDSRKAVINVDDAIFSSVIAFETEGNCCCFFCCCCCSLVSLPFSSVVE